MAMGRAQEQQHEQRAGHHHPLAFGARSLFYRLVYGPVRLV